MAEYFSLNGLSSDIVRVYTASEYKPIGEYDQAIDSRLRLAMQERSIEHLWNSSAMIVGCGTLGTALAQILACKGIGSDPNCLILCDDDVVAPENLATQDYLRDQVHMPKVFALAELILESSPHATKTIAVNASYREMTRLIPDLLAEIDIVYAAVDSGLWRGRISQDVHPCSAFVTGGLSQNTAFGWVFWHTPDLPNMVEALAHKCTGQSPGCAGVIADVSKTVAGVMSYVGDHALFRMKDHYDPCRPLGWQYWRIFLDGIFEDEFIQVEEG